MFDPDDTLACARLVAALADLGAGRAVCHPTPGDPNGIWLAVDLLVALGKRLDAPVLERVSRRAWPLAEVWLRAEPITDLFVLRAHLLGPRALCRLVALPQRCGLRLWLIVHRPALRPAQQRTLDAAPWCAIDLPAFCSRWPAGTDHPDLSGPPVPVGRAHGDADASGFPAVPGADFPVFRAACRRLLDPDSFAEVDRCYCDTMRRLLAWLADQGELLHTSAGHSAASNAPCVSWTAGCRQPARGWAAPAGTATASNPNRRALSAGAWQRLDHAHQEHSGLTAATATRLCLLVRGIPLASDAWEGDGGLRQLRQQQLIEGEQPPFRLSADVRYSLLLDEYE